MTGPLLLATSCLQGRPLADAARELRALGVDGLQLTPGLLPDPGFAPAPGDRTHQGFRPDVVVGPVWDGARLVAASDSVHPPRPQQVDAATFWAAVEAAPPPTVLEVMDAPTRLLGTEDEVDRAMALGLWLAVDVSHVDLQRAWGVMGEAGWRRLAAYDRVAEVHVSQRHGRIDAHRPLRADTFGLAWARERRRSGTPLVLEAYLHGLTDAQRLDQLALLDA